MLTMRLGSYYIQYKTYKVIFRRGLIIYLNIDRKYFIYIYIFMYKISDF